MSFHAKQKAATGAIEQTLQQHPELAGRVQELDRHYMLGGLEKPSPIGLYAALRLHVDQGYQDVVGHLSRRFQLVIGQAEKYLVDAVNQGPSSLKDDEEFLHGKGIMRGVDRYYLGYKGIHTGSTYDRAWQAVDPAHRPIIAEALTAAISQKHKIMEKRVLKYVAVLLMPEGDAKLFMLNKLSIKSEKKHGSYVREACDFIRIKAHELGIVVSETLLANKAASHPLPKIPAPPGSARKPEKAANPVSREFTGGALPAKSPVVAHDGQGEETAAPRQDMVKLKRDLKTLERRNKISEKEAKIYFWLKNDTDDAPRTVEGAAKRSGLDIRKIQIIVAKVNLALRKMEEPVPAVASEGNLHKAGAVRP